MPSPFPSGIRIPHPRSNREKSRPAQDIHVLSELDTLQMGVGRVTSRAGFSFQAFALRFTAGFATGWLSSCASRARRNRSVLASRADFSPLMICWAARVVASLFFSPVVGFGLKVPAGTGCRIAYSFITKKAGQEPDLLQSASMANASTSVVKDQKRLIPKVCRHRAVPTFAGNLAGPLVGIWCPNASVTRRRRDELGFKLAAWVAVC